MNVNLITDQLERIQVVFKSSASKIILGISIVTVSVIWSSYSTHAADTSPLNQQPTTIKAIWCKVASYFDSECPDYKLNIVAKRVKNILKTLSTTNELGGVSKQSSVLAASTNGDNGGVAGFFRDLYCGFNWRGDSSCLTPQTLSEGDSVWLRGISSPTGITATQLQLIKGDKGDRGDKGDKGDDGFLFLEESVGGISSLNGLTGSIQVIAAGTLGTNFNISSAGTTHTFNIPDASSTARGLVTTNAQTIAGTKTFSGTVNLSGLTASQVVLTDSSKNLTTTEKLGVSMGGTGLDASLASNGQLLIGNGTGFILATVTGTSNQVTVTNGGGTITLSTPQDISSSSLPQFAGIGIGIAGQSNKIVGGSSLNIEAGGTDKNIRITPSGTGYVILDGNVGIGTTNPTGKLDIYGNLVVSNSGTTTFSGLAYSWPSSQSANGILQTDGSGNLVWGTSGGTGVLGYWNRVNSTLVPSNTNDNIGTLGNVGIGTTTPYSPTTRVTVKGTGTNSGISFLTQDSTGANKFAILDNGNVGIGTTSPVYNLDVTGTIRATTSIDLGGAQGRITLGAHYFNGSAIIQNWNGNGIRLMQNTTDTGFILNSSGNVGIGTVSPGARLQVVGADSLNTSFAGNISGATGTGLVVTNAGNVGIGTTGPELKLHIVGTAGAPASNPASSVGSLRLQAGTNSVLDFGNTDTATAYTNWIQSRDRNSSNNYYSLALNPNGGNVGIGTAGPLQKLHVAGSVMVSGGGGLYMGTNSAANYTINLPNNNGIGFRNAANSADVMGIKVGTDDKVYVGAGADTIMQGNVGIGTTAPGAKLDVNGSIKLSGTDNIILNGNWLSGDGGDEGVFVATDGKVGIGGTPQYYSLEVKNAGDSTAYVGTTGTAGAAIVMDAPTSGHSDVIWQKGGASKFYMTVPNNTTDQLVIKDIANSLNMVTFKSGGNVGIGTTAPGAKLEIYDGGTSANSLFTIQADDQNPWALRILNRTYSTNIDSGFSVYQGNTGELVMRNMSSDTLTLKSGNVGIGTTAPSAKLHVLGGVGYFADNLSFPAYRTEIGGSWVDFEGNIGADIASIQYGGSSRLQFNGTNQWFNSGNVGIGTTAPGAYKLNVAGSIYSITGDASGGLIGFGSGSTAIGAGMTAGGYMGYSGASTTVVYSGSGMPLLLGINGSEKVRIDTSGNVGIGTTGPAVRLQVHANADTGMIANFRNLSGTHKFQFYQENDGAASLYLGGNAAISESATVPSYFGGAAGVAIGANNPGTAKLYINGNVGIGTTGPLSALHVAGTTGINWNGAAGSISYGLVTVGTVGSGGSLFVNTPSLSTDWASGLGITGTYTHPRSVVNINAYGVKSGAGGAAGYGADLAFSTANGGSLNEIMRITNTGNVGIGTTGPGAKLSFVTGTTAAGGIDFGGDVSLYRSGADSLKTDDALTVGGDITASSTNWNIKNSGASGRLSLGAGGVESVLVIHNTGATANTMYLQNGNVGIGTTSPISKLQIGNITSNPTFTTTPTEKIVLGTTTDTGETAFVNYIQESSNNPRAKFFLSDNTNLAGIDVTASNTIPGIDFQLNGTSALRIANSGNVGIGTTSPTTGYKLDVAGDIQGYNFNASGNGGNFTGYYFQVKDGGFLGFYDSGLTRDVNISRIGVNKIAVGTGANGSTTGTLIAGSVGIGTTAPLSALHVVGTTGITWNGGAGSISYGLATIGTAGTGGSLFVNTPSLSGDWSSGLGITGTYASTRSVININAYGVKSGTYGSDLAFSITKLGALTEAMRIDTNGNVGIGTTGPGAYKLNVAGSIYSITGDASGGLIGFGSGSTAIGAGMTAGGYMGYSGASTTVVYSGSGMPLLLGINGSEKVRIDTSGNVGIGTTGPAVRLQVHANADTGMIANFRNLSGTHKFQFYQENDGAASLYLGGNAVISESATVPSYFGGAAGVAIGANNPGTAKLYINGNVGIGTTSPAYPLDVNGMVRVKASDYWVQFINSSGAEKGSIRATNQFTITGRDSGGVGTLSLNSGAPSYLNGGNVGIGTAAPGDKLHVVGDIRAEGQFDIYTGASGGYVTLANQQLFNGGNLDLRIDANNNEADGTNYFAFTKDAGTELMRITDSGNVGIGTTSPGANLQVTAARPALALQATDASANKQIWDWRADNNGLLSLRAVNDAYNSASTVISIARGSSTAADSIAFLTGSGSTTAEAMRILNNGNVGIGTTGPGYALDVAGAIRSGGNIYMSSGILSGNSSELDLRAAYIGDGWVALRSYQSIGLVANRSGTQADQPIRFKNYTTDLMTILSGGNVGIGTTGPGYKLDVSGSINISAGSAYKYNGTNVITAQTALENFFFGNAGNLSMTGTANTAIGSGALSANTTAGSNTAFGSYALTANTTGQLNSAFGNQALTSNTTGSGNVALGALTLYELNILDSTGNNTAIGYNTGRGITTGINNTIIGANVTLPATISNNIIIADGAGNRRINVDSGGNVGIGTTSPQVKLDLYSNSNSTIVNQLRLRNIGTGNGSGTRLGFSGGGGDFDANFIQGYYQDVTNAWSLGFATGGSSTTNGSLKMMINTSGNVGIGTTSPGTKLEVNGAVALANNNYLQWRDVAAGALQSILKYGNNDSVTLQSPVTATVGSGALTLAGNNNTALQATDGRLDLKTVTDNSLYYIALHTANQERVRITNAGNVGIGTTGPAQKLDVWGNIKATGGVLISTAGSLTGFYASQVQNGVSSIGAGGAVGYGGNSTTVLWAGSGMPLVFGTNGSEYMRLSATGGLSLGSGYVATDAGAGNMIISGNVGIGTTGPAARLQVHANADTGMIANFRNLSGTHKFQFYQENDGAASLYLGGNAVISESATVPSYFGGAAGVAIGANNPGTAKLYINGNVGIGTTNPGYKLQVGSAGDGSEARANAWNSLSDIRFKDNVTPLTNSLEKVLKLQGVSFNWKSSGKESLGLIAQSVREIFPEIVSSDGEGVLSLNYAGLAAPLTEAIKEQQEEILANIASITALDLRTKNVVATEDGRTLIKGIVLADTLKANRVEGLEVKSGIGLNEIDDRLVKFGQTLGSINEQLQALQSQKFNNTFPTAITLKSLVVSEGVTFRGTVTFNGPAVFMVLAEFIDKVVFRKDVEFAGNIMVGSNSAGKVTITSGQMEVKVVFEREYTDIPVVQLTPLDIYDLKYAVRDITPKGFIVKIFPLQDKEVEFNWMALAVKDGKTTKSEEIVGNPTPEAAPTIIPAPEVTVNPPPAVEPVLSPESSSSAILIN